MILNIVYLLIGVIIGIFTIGIFSGQAYDKGYKDAKRDLTNGV
ncbi:MULTISPECIES: hypothetical protein [Bacillus]|nr:MULTISPECIES: hypothetical protein [Bacillus]